MFLDKLHSLYGNINASSGFFFFEWVLFPHTTAHDRKLSNGFELTDLVYITEVFLTMKLF